MQLNACTRFKRRIKTQTVLHQQRLLVCCSGPCSPPARSTCARSTAGKLLPRRLSIAQLTSPPEPITSCRWRLRHIEFQHKARNRAPARGRGNALLVGQSIGRRCNRCAFAARSIDNPRGRRRRAWRRHRASIRLGSSLSPVPLMSAARGTPVSKTHVDVATASVRAAVTEFGIRRWLEVV